MYLQRLVSWWTAAQALKEDLSVPDVQVDLSRGCGFSLRNHYGTASPWEWKVLLDNCRGDHQRFFCCFWALLLFFPPLAAVTEHGFAIIMAMTVVSFVFRVRSPVILNPFRFLVVVTVYIVPRKWNQEQTSLSLLLLVHPKWIFLPPCFAGFVSSMKRSDWLSRLARPQFQPARMRRSGMEILWYRNIFYLHLRIDSWHFNGISMTFW